MFDSKERKITVNKKNLIDRIKKNRENHIIDYDKAVIAYKKEANKQLNNLLDKVNKGEMGIKLNLNTPINSSVDYDHLIEMFEWEVNDEVELDYSEFKRYIQDQTDFAVRAKLMNASYV